MFCGHCRCAGATKRRDKMCFWSTAGTPNPPGQATPDTLLLLVKSDPFAVFLPRLRLANVSRPHSKLCTRSSFLGAQNFRTKYVVMKQFIDCLGENYEISKSARTDTQLPKDSRGSVALAASEQLLFRNVRPTFVMKRSCAGAYA